MFLNVGNKLKRVFGVSPSLNHYTSVLNGNHFIRCLAQAKLPVKPPPAILWYVYEVKPEFQEILGCKETTRADGIKFIYQYFTDNNLKLADGGYTVDEKIGRVYTEGGLLNSKQVLSLVSGAYGRLIRPLSRVEMAKKYGDKYEYYYTYLDMHPDFAQLQNSKFQNSIKKADEKLGLPAKNSKTVQVQGEQRVYPNVVTTPLTNSTVRVPKTAR